MYDVFLELAVSSYELDKKNRKAELKDRLQYFILWWNKNKSAMGKYNTLVELGGLVKKDHATILHYLKRRKPTINYEYNTACIRDFLNS